MRFRFFIFSFVSIVLLLGGFVLGFVVGLKNIPEIDHVQGLENTTSVIAEYVDFEPFWKVWNVINDKYVGDESVSDQDKVWGAIQGLTDSLGDPYSVFLTPEESQLFADDIAGNFGGVGMEIGIRDEVLTVIAPLRNTPAEKAGLLPGDVIVAIDDVSSLDLSVDEAVRLIRGEPGTTVQLSIIREGVSEVLEIEVMRDIILVPTIATELRDDGVFVIALFNFDSTAVQDFRSALRDFAQSGSTKLLLDVRGNPGGFLEAAVDIASFFLPAGEVIVRESYGDDREEKTHRSRGYNAFAKGNDMVILIDNGSASASEIVAGALQEYDIATLIGETTFGKGSVQELIDVTSDTYLKLTIARWLTPEGRSISDGGLAPDIEVEMSLDDFMEGRDPQLEKAVDFLLAE